MSKFSRALWERHQHGYIMIAVFLLLLSFALLQNRGWVAVLSIWALLLVGLEWPYRQLHSLAKRHKSRWWAKPRRPISRAYTGLAVGILAVLIESQAARYWVIATAVGAVLVALGIRWHRMHEDEGPPPILGKPKSSSGGDGA